MSKDVERKPPRRVVALSLLLAAAAAQLVVAQSARTQKASAAAVHKEIESLQRRVAREVTERDENARTLRAFELKITAGSRKLAEVHAELREQQAHRRELGAEERQAGERLQAERAALATQVRMSYMTGREEIFKLLLSQETPADLGRMLVYYDYFNRARSERIADIGAQVSKLKGLGAESARVEHELAALEKTQNAELASLGHARDERRDLLAKLETTIKDDKSEIARLADEEKRLKKLADEISQMTAGFPVDPDQPFERLKGKLAWPVQGRLVGDYGQPRAGGPVKWNGVEIEASQGAPVRAVYHGRVEFADWLPGLGLLIIVDHGDGYMSLYAHNEALLKEAGDWVEPGEAIAQVGDTGGQARPSLYFEIRKNGEPVNPHAWIGSRPPGR
jgi:murein hydrolase activator